MNQQEPVYIIGQFWSLSHVWQWNFFFNDQLGLYVAVIKWIKWVSFKCDPGNHTLRGSL